jgi:hypothetical protein
MDKVSGYGLINHVSIHGRMSMILSAAIFTVVWRINKLPIHRIVEL